MKAPGRRALMVACVIVFVLGVVNAIASHRPGLKFAHGSLAIVAALVFTVLVTSQLSRREDDHSDDDS